MSAKADSETDRELSHGVEIAAKGYDLNTEDQLLNGTEHILINGEPLCGNHHVKKGIEKGRYGTETTRHPLNGHDTCQKCGSVYVKRFGSEHDLFERVAGFDEGEWVEIEMADGSTKTGRVRYEAEKSEFPSRRLGIVVSDEPQDRWVYGIEDELKIRVEEGESPVICRGDILDDDYHEEEIADVSSTTAPVDNIDELTQATLEELESIAGSRAKTVMTLGADRKHFHINARESLDSTELWELLDDFYKAGYEVKGVTTGEERSGTDCTAISLIAKSLESALVAAGGSGLTLRTNPSSRHSLR